MIAPRFRRSSVAIQLLVPVTGVHSLAKRGNERVGIKFGAADADRLLREMARAAKQPMRHSGRCATRPVFQRFAPISGTPENPKFINCITIQACFQTLEYAPIF